MRLVRLVLGFRAVFVIALLLLTSWRTACQTQNVQALITRTVDEKNFVSLAGNVHPLARPEFDQGPVAGEEPLNRMMLLLPRSPEQEAALKTVLKEQQDISSPSYHVWLTPEEFGKRFGPADSDIQTVTAWLTSQGFTDIQVGAGRTAIEFSGNVGSVRSAFHTEIHRYLVNGEEHIANASDPQIPVALAPVIAGIVSLHDFRKKPMYRLAGNTPAFSGLPTAANPEYTFNCVDFLTSIFGAFSGQSPTCHAVGPYDFATIYNVLPLWNTNPAMDGTGQTIAIVGRTNIDVQDISDFRTMFGLPANPPQIILDGIDPGIVPGDETEADLDVEWSGAVAKGATIKLVVSQSTETTDGVDLSALYIVDHNLASVMSESYGQCEFNLGAAGNQFYNNLWQQAAAQGISVFVASGDNGSAGCDFELDHGLLPPQPAQFGLAVNGIASTPYNVAVGGTDFDDYFTASTYWNATNNGTTLESAKSYIPETTWNSSCTNAFLEDPRVRLTTNPETNCNNSTNLGTERLVVATGGSGGKSTCTAPTGTTVSSCSGGYAKPNWQVASGVPNDGMRDLPDVSLFASSGFFDSYYMMCESDLLQPAPQGHLTCSTSAFVGVGGTSVSSPSFAGLLALVNQKTAARQGNVNPVLYGLAAKQSSSSCNSSVGPASTCVFNDVTSGTIAMPCVTGSPNCTTANAGDTVGILSGYQAGTGYDLATGLGSVNANNLINNWNSVVGAASTTTLTLNSGNAINVTHGTPVNVAVSVSPTSPQPTGLASLTATQGSNSFGFDTLTLSNGTASGTTNMLPGGASYNVQAHYTGDANYAGSDSNAVTVTVNPEPSATNVRVATLDLSTGQVSNPNATSIPYGSVYVLRADVSNASAAACFNTVSASLTYGCPTGSVSFALDGTALGSGPNPLNSEGYTENQSVQLTGGPHTFSGNYSGDNSYLASSGTDSVTVIPAPTVIGSLQGPVLIGPDTFNVLARTSNIGIYSTPPTGTFTIFDGNTQLPSTVTGAGPGVIFPSPNSPYVWETFSGNVNTTLPGPSGTHMLTLNYSGDANYGPSTSGAFSVDEVYPTQMTLTPSASPIVNGQPVTLIAKITPSQSASVPPTGNVTFGFFGVSGSPIGTAAVSNSQAQITIPSLGTGSTDFQANYSGDSNYAASSGTAIVTVTSVNTTTSISSSISTAAQNTSVTFIVRINPAQMGIAPVSGTVYLTANGIEIGNLTVSNNQAQATTSFPMPGQVQIQANYSGDANYAASTATFTQTVTAPPGFSVASSGTTTQSVNAGQAAIFTNAITVSALNGFSAQVNLSCSLPAIATNTTCTANPNSFATGSGTTTITVTTAARGLMPPSLPINRFLLQPQLLTFPLMMLLAMLVLCLLRTRRQRLAYALPLMMMVVFLLLNAVGCGGGGYSSPPPPTGTPAGAYTVTVTGTSGTTAHTTTLTLTVM